jgi:OOP family OmpA-OmpF porin
VPVPAEPLPAAPGRVSAGAWDGKANSFTALVDLSSSTLWLAPCRGGLVKAEAESTLLRKMSQRLPDRPYVAALRVFGYQQAWREADYSTLYYGPAAYERQGFEQAVARLTPANAISPFSVGIRATAEELAAMPDPRAVLMLSDFEVTSSPGDPPQESGRLRGRFGGETRVYAFFVTKDRKAKALAASIAAAGGGKSYDVCAMLEDEPSFEAMMDEIFGPKVEPPCRDSDGDGVCDEQDQCPYTPQGAPVDGRGCWIAAYSQFFDFDKAVVKSAFVPRIQYAAEIIKANPQIGEIVIAGHTDAKGTDAYNMDLGRRRAEAVRELLVKSGAPAERLRVESFGKSRPIAENTTEEGRAQNRRVEFHVGEVPPAR